VLKLNSHVEPSYEHSQLLYNNSLPFSVLKLINLALIVKPVVASYTEQLSKYHSVDSEFLSFKLTFSLTHHPEHSLDDVVVGVGTSTGTMLSNTFLFSNV